MNLYRLVKENKAYVYGERSLYLVTIFFSYSLIVKFWTTKW